LPGHGKSLYAVSRYVLPALRRSPPRVVYHNIDGLEQKKNLIPNYFRDISEDVPSQFLVEIPNERVPRFYDFIAAQRHRGDQYALGCLIIIDEVQNYFSARDFQNQNNKDLVNYMTKHRHLYHDVLFITQHQDNVDAAVRRLVDVSYMVVNNKNFGSSKSSRIYTYNRDVIGPKLELSVGTYSYDPKIFGLYSSYEPTKDKNFKEVKVNIKWWKHPKILMSLGFLLFCFLWFFYNLQTGKGNKGYLSAVVYGGHKEAKVSAYKSELPKKPPSVLYQEIFHSGDTTFYLCKTGRIDTSFTSQPWEACK